MKPPDIARGHRRHPQLVEVEGRAARAPRPPEGLREETRKLWGQLWHSPVAQAWDPHSDLPVLVRYIRLLDRWLRYDELLGRAPLVQGSRGQLRPNPLAARLDAVEAQVHVLEEHLGLTPSARMRLGLSLFVGRQAVSSWRTRDQRDLEERKRALAEPDPRWVLYQQPDPRRIFRPGYAPAGDEQGSRVAAGADGGGAGC
jgi:P27 family predicted phage terminase small subunit